MSRHYRNKKAADMSFGDRFYISKCRYVVSEDAVVHPDYVKIAFLHDMPEDISYYGRVNTLRVIPETNFQVLEEDTAVSSS